MKSQVASDIEKEAMKLFFKNDLEGALRKINSAIQIDTSNYRYLDDRACIYQKMGRYKEAYSDIDRVIAINPDYTYSYLHKAFFLLDEVKFKESVDVSLIGLKKCGKRDSLKFNFYNNLGVAYSFLNDFENSKKYYRLAVGIEPNNADVLVNLSSVENKSGNRNEAIKILKELIMKDSLKANVFNNLGMRYIETENYDGAISCFNKAIYLEPKDGISYNNRGFCLFKLGHMEDALTDINVAIFLAPSNPYAFRNKALVYLSQGKKELACLDLNQAQKLGYTEMYGKEVQELIKINCK